MFFLTIGSDSSLTSSPESCGGVIQLTSSAPFFAFKTPFYSGNYMYRDIDCQWFISGPSTERVQLTWLNIETTYYTYVSVHDLQTHPVYATGMEFMHMLDMSDLDVTTSPIISSSEGLMLYHDTSSYDSRFQVNVSLRGERNFQISPECKRGSIHTCVFTFSWETRVLFCVCLGWDIFRATCFKNLLIYSFIHLYRVSPPPPPKKKSGTLDFR